MIRDTTKIVVAASAGIAGALAVCIAIGSTLDFSLPIPGSLAVILAAAGGALVTLAAMLWRGRRATAHHADELLRAVTEQTRMLADANAQQQKALTAAESADRAKSNFLMNVSHELRTPLTAILGYADLLTAPDLPVHERAEFVQQVRRAGRHLLSLINDLLDISRIETGELVVIPRPINPCSVVEEVVSLARPQIGAKLIHLQTDIVAPFPETVMVDPDRLRQALMCLVDNAIKFTDHGEVTVRMTFQPAPNPLIRFDVCDTGPGIESERLHSLFATFTQRDDSAARRHTGLGAGLSLAHKLVHLLGGQITVESRTGHGSTFSIMLPTGPLEGVSMRMQVRTGDRPAEDAAASAAAATSDAHVHPLAGRRILFVEDGPDNRRLVCFHLQRAGAVVETAEDGQQGHDAALAAIEAGRPFDLILMDMQMPRLDGYAATSLLRSGGYAGTIIAFTAHAMTGDRERCLKAGCDDYLTKPIDRTALLAAAERWTSPAAVSQTAQRWKRVADGTRTRDPENHNLVL